jgi:hypothetical protein
MAYLNFKAINAARRKAKAVKEGENAPANNPVITGPLSEPPPAPIVLEAPAVIDGPVLHGVAKCRWCQKPFRRYDESKWICQTSTCADRQLAAAMRKAGDEQGPILFLPLPLQIDVDESPINKLLVAGAAGVSKSTGCRWNAYRKCRQVSGYRVLLLRTTYDTLTKNHLQFMPSETKALGDAVYRVQPKTVTFEQEDGNESMMFAGYCDVDADIAQFVGPEFDLICLEEGVTLLPRAIEEITAKARGSGTARLSHQRLGLTAGRVRIWSNPGGRAMRFLVTHYIKKNPDRAEFPKYDPNEYGWISCTLEDNPYLDEHYDRRVLSGLSATRYRQLRYGDWSIYAGQFFETFDPAIHLTDAEPA